MHVLGAADTQRVRRGLQALSTSFAQACEARPDQVTEHLFAVGGSPVYARVAGNDVAAMLRRSLASGIANGPGLTLELWDEEATGVELSIPTAVEGGLDWLAPGGDPLGLSSDGRYVTFAEPTFVICMDRAEQRAIGWMRSEKRLSSWHRARPLQSLFLPWIVARGATVVHAAMVSWHGVGIVLAGPAQSGKSTSLAACGAGGFGVLGDDTIALELRDGRVLGHCVHAAVKLRWEGLDRHPSIKKRTHRCGPPSNDGAVAFLNEVFPGQVAASAEVVAIGFPELGTSPDTRFTPVTQGHALRTLTGCLLSAGPGNIGSVFAAISDVVEQIPAYRISIGADTGRVADGIRALLVQLRSGNDDLAMGAA